MRNDSLSIPPPRAHRLSKSQQARLRALQVLSVVRLHAALQAMHCSHIDVDRLAQAASMAPWAVRELLDSHEWQAMVLDSAMAHLGLVLHRAITQLDGLIGHPGPTIALRAIQACTGLQGALRAAAM